MNSKKPTSEPPGDAFEAGKSIGQPEEAIEAEKIENEGLVSSNDVSDSEAVSDFENEGLLSSNDVSDSKAVPDFDNK